MSEILANIVLEQTELNFTPEVNNINITPEAINLNVFAGGYTNGAGNNYEVQYNFGGVLTSSPQLTFNNPANTLVVGGNITTNNLTVNALGTLATANITNLNVSGSSNVNTILASGNANLPTINNGNLYTTGNANISVLNISANANLGNVGNIKILGGNVNDVLTTDGTGNLSWSDGANANYANFAGNVINAAQPNITSLGTLTGLTVTGNAAFTGANVSMGNVSNLKITGGTNGYVLQTDGTGNLTWVVGTGNVTGNGVPGGANTQIQFNDGGANFGGSAGFTFNKSSNVFSAPGNANITGSITSNNANLGNAATANYFIGNLYGTANIATVAGTVTTNAQPNITSLGNLTSLTVVGMTSIQEAKEKANVNSTGANGTVNYDILDQAIILQTGDASGNFTLNFRGNSTTTFDSIINNNESLTCTFINKNGTTPYILSGIQIDGSSRTPLWFNNNAPNIGTPNGRDFYTFNIIKTTTNTFTILASTGNII